MSDQNLVITGMMGSGKSTVAPLVAYQLKRQLIDTDAEIEKRFNKSINSIFHNEGEDVFRKAEADLCAELAGKKGLVIATGGGFLVPSESQFLMHRHSVFCLDASEKNLIARTRNSNNEGRPRVDQIKTLIKERQDAYQRIFHHIDTNHLDIENVANEIVERFKIDSAFRNDNARMVRMPLQPPYPVIVKKGAASEIFSRLAWMGVRTPRIIVITNETLKTLYGTRLEGKQVDWLVIPPGEQFKTLETVERLYHDLLVLNTKRDDVIVALGGGVVGDVAGYVAATYMRGLRLVQVPTTLLAMVDSSIGGKTGVDLKEGKNLIGAFKQPLMVLADTSLLESLPKEEYSSGMAEAIKHAMIGDPALFESLEQGPELNREELVRRALYVKADIVEEDPFEHDRRAVLNLGHTFGHAFEKVSGYSMRHGEAVAMGMVAACELAQRLSLCDASLRMRVEQMLLRFGLPTRIPRLSVDSIMDAFKHDKKSTFKGLQFVVPHGVGDVRIQTVSDEKLLREVLESVGQ